MPTKPLPINVGIGAAIEETTAPALYRADAVNVYFDLAGNVIRRPGISEFCTVGTGSSAGIRGMYWWEFMQVLLVVYNTNIYRVDENGAVTTIASSLFEATGYTTFAEFNDAVYAANGGEIIKIQYSSAAAVADGDAPTSVEGVVEMDGYLLAHDGLGCHVYYSDANDPDSWSGDWISPAQTFSEIKAIGVKNNILEIVGDTG